MRRLFGLLVVAIIAAAAAPAWAQTPDAFMSRVLARLNAKGVDSLELPLTAAWYEPGFLKLMKDNEALSQARDFSGGVLEGDPVCQCQTTDGTYAVVRIALRGADAADVRMRISYSSDPQAAGPRDYTIGLRRIGEAWRIAEVVSDGKSTRAALTHENTCLRAHRSEAAITRCLGPE